MNLHWDQVSFLEVVLLYGAGYLMFGEWVDRLGRSDWASRLRSGGATIVCGGTFMQIYLKVTVVDTSIRGAGWWAVAIFTVVGLGALGMGVNPKKRTIDGRKR